MKRNHGKPNSQTREGGITQEASYRAPEQRQFRHYTRYKEQGCTNGGKKNGPKENKTKGRAIIEMGEFGW